MASVICSLSISPTLCCHHSPSVAFSHTGQWECADSPSCSKPQLFCKHFPLLQTFSSPWHALLASPAWQTPSLSSRSKASDSPNINYCHCFISSYLALASAIISMTLQYNYLLIVIFLDSKWLQVKDKTVLISESSASHPVPNSQYMLSKCWLKALMNMWYQK